MRAVVLGGGIAGLAAARRLEQLGVEEIALVESSHRLGGKIGTERFDGFVVEQAPDSFLSRKERGVGLCEELGLSAELVGRRPEYGRTFVRRGGQLVPLPSGLTGMVPTDLGALEGSELLSEAGRERLAREPSEPVRRDAGDESIASFATRRLGREAYEAIVEPLMTGIYGGDGDRLSLDATFPQLRALELEHGSVLRGLAREAPGERDRTPPFLSLRRGMDTLVSALVAGLERTRTFTGVAARAIEHAHLFNVRLADGSALEADALVVALPGFVAADVLESLDQELADAHGDIPYGSSVIVTVALGAADVERPVDGYGYLVPRSERSDVLACTWTSRKWPGRAPDDAHLVRVFAGRFGGRDLTVESDADLVALARAELSSVGVDAEPLFTRVQRWAHGMPQYVIGHPARLEAIDEALGRHPGLALAGAAYRGVGIPDCIRSGEEAAEAAVRSLAPARA